MEEPPWGGNSYSLSPSQSGQGGEGDRIMALDNVIPSVGGRHRQEQAARPVPCSLSPNPWEIEYSADAQPQHMVLFPSHRGYQVTGTDPQWLLVTLSLVTTC